MDFGNIRDIRLRIFRAFLLLAYASFHLLNNYISLIDIFIALHNVFDHFFHMYKPFPLLSFPHFSLSYYSLAIYIHFQYDSSIIQDKPLNKMFIIQTLFLQILSQSSNSIDFFSFLNILLLSLPLRFFLPFNLRLIIDLCS